MSKLGIYYEQDDAGNDTGRVQVVEEIDEEEGFVLETFDTEKEAEEYMAKLQAKYDRNDKIKAEYLQWEKECMVRHNITEDELREYLANAVCI